MKKILFIAALLLIASLSRAAVSLPSVFSDNMVLQQNSKVKIWGTSSNQGLVTIYTSWNNQQYVAQIQADGNWEASVNTPSYGGPYEIRIDDQEQLILSNILIGEVWLCSGQSNMEMPLAGWGKIENYAQEIANADFPDIRFLQVKQRTSDFPLYDATVENNGWVAVSPETIDAFSATAYFFAREIYSKTGIPIGLIHTSWGGTVAEAWTSREALTEIPDFHSALQRLGNVESKHIFEQEMAIWNQLLMQNDQGRPNGTLGWLAPEVNDGDWPKMQLPNMWDTEILPGFDGIVYFRKKIQLPMHWIGQKIELHLGMIDDDDMTYWNGSLVGETQGYNQNRIYKIPASHVQTQEVSIAVRVFDGGGGGGIYGNPEELYVLGPNKERISLASEWKYNIGLDLSKLPPMPSPNEGPNRATVLYNAMIHPFIPFNIRGVIWYQGESNVERANQYRTLFPAMINDWRKKWKLGEFPFYYVQLANYMKRESETRESAWAELRDAQKDALALPNTDMAVIADIGDADDIHPKNKQEVGRRLALLALKNQYKQQVISGGPELLSYRIRGDEIHLKFKPNGSKLVSNNRDQVLAGFSIAGEDQIFYWAEGRIKGNVVIVKSKNVAKPVAVRYGWANNPDLSLYNAEGLPASPFKTDDWRDSTTR
ncbi:MULTISPECIES: sialate O-acetylesterase [Sphingobacterium]|uniref:Sialate O-acetylesterase n=1 Tax=Sphingobacterium populi TaxID=1812824 RepID=A0ABW5UDS4_9SPHI|nr:sialate O-acetylesterase [Sphingobacterium sp. CFCC 11742]